MSAITAAAVKELREITGVAMMDCKKALVECNGDLDEAKEFLRKKGQAKALKKSSRETREGAIGIRFNETQSSGTIVKLACETDFVARNDSFQALLQSLGGQVLSQGSESLLEQQLVDGVGTVQDLINGKVAELGENMQLLDSARLEVKQGYVGGYVHMTGKIGVLVSLETEEACKNPLLEQLAHDLAMHIAASNPLSTDKSDLDSKIIIKEEEIIKEQLKTSGKKKEIIDKIAKGKMSKFISENTLLNQTWIMDPDKKVKDVIKEIAGNNIVKVKNFIRYKVGEGI